MVNAHHRKKQPEQVRRTLLDCAARIAAEQGIANVTVQAVAEAAGVTKGGLFHHFPNKKMLVDAVFADLLERLDHEIDAHLAEDKEQYGRFTRAYVEVTFADHRHNGNNPWTDLSLSMVIEPDLRPMWSKWLADRLERHSETDRNGQLEIVRLAADGAWLAFTSHIDADLIIDVCNLRVSLIDLTRPH